MPTVLSDIYFQDELRDYMAQPIIEQTNFFQSGIITRNNDMTALLNSPSNEFVIPFWLDLDYSIEPNYGNDVFTDVASPLSVATSSMRGRTAYLNEGWATANLVKNITNQDPLEYVQSRLTGYWQRQYQRRLLSSALGVYNSNVANNDGDMVVEAGGVISPEAIIRANASMGDYGMGSMGVIAMHSAVHTQLSLQNMIDFTPIADQVPQFGRFQGKTVVVDDGMPATTNAEGVTTYISILFGTGAIGFAENQPAGLDGLAVDRVEERGNGQGFETMWTRRDVLIHPFGYSFTSAVITGNGTETRPMSPSWQDLTDAQNWTRAVESRRMVPLTFITSTSA